jgi:predicted dehydrogenase
MSKLKIAVLGYANIAKRAIIPAIKLSENFKLTGIASRNIENRHSIESEHLCKYYSDYKELVLDPTIHALYIPLPNALHYKWAKLALENNKHLLVEKSLACTFKEVQDLNILAEKKNLALVENFQFRKHSQLKEIKSVISSGELGEIRAIRTSFGFPPFPDQNNIRYQKELGGGALLDAGAYLIKLSQELLGYDLTVTSSVLAHDGHEVDIWGGGMLKDKNSTNFVQFSFGFDHYYQCSLEVWGSKAKLFTNRIYTAPPGYEPIIELEFQNDKKELKLEADNHFVNMLDHFYNCTVNQELRVKEFKANINQSKLLSEFLKMSKIE